MPVFHPGPAAQAQPAGVASGGDPVAGGGGQTVAEGDGGGAAGARNGGGQPVQSGALVEFGDEVVGGCQQDGVAACGHIVCPGVVGHVGGDVVGADMHPVVVEVERQTGRVAVAQCEAGRTFGFADVGVGEAHHGVQGERVVARGDVAQHSAGGDGGQLLVVADQAHAGAGCDSLIWPQGDGSKWLHLCGGGVSL